MSIDNAGSWTGSSGSMNHRSRFFFLAGSLAAGSSPLLAARRTARLGACVTRCAAMSLVARSLK
ncbi:hypothetical protein [Sorangium sp. So ce1335]|uniref:hypothetical protein n=1 Tax=Sorangium sp. So ce1335 TaxID=3133335 RepID=UPI003F5DC5F7